MEEEQKLRRKLSRQDTAGSCVEVVRREVEEQCLALQEEERQALGRISQAERGHFLGVARSLQPLLEQQAVLGARLLAGTGLQELLTGLDALAEDRGRHGTARDRLDSLALSLASPGYDFPTPPPSPGSSLRGSRRGSLSSLGSFTGSLPRPSRPPSPSPLPPSR